METNMRITMNNLNPDVISHNRLPDLVLNKLMDWIMDGKLHMGEKLNTEELASQLGVSRMPIREALSNLEKKGLAESVPYVGTRLIKLTKEDVRQIYIIRTALEPLAARYACMNITSEDIQVLEEINRNYKELMQCEGIKAKEVYRLNRQFHFTIYSISGIERLCTMIESLWDSLSFFKLIYGQKYITNPDAGERMMEEHDSYLEALKAKDADLLQQLLTSNLTRRARDIPYEPTAYFDTVESK